MEICNVDFTGKWVLGDSLTFRPFKILNTDTSFPAIVLEVNHTCSLEGKIVKAHFKNENYANIIELQSSIKDEKATFIIDNAILAYDGIWEVMFHLEFTENNISSRYSTVESVHFEVIKAWEGVIVTPPPLDPIPE